MPAMTAVALPDQLGLAVDVVCGQAQPTPSPCGLLGMRQRQAPLFAAAEAAPLAAQDVQSQVVPLMAYAAAEAVLKFDAQVFVGEACAALGFGLQAKAQKAIGCELSRAGFTFGGFRLWATSSGLDDALAAPGSAQNIGAGRLPFMTLRAPEAVRCTNADILCIEASSTPGVSDVVESGQIARLEIGVLDHAALALVSA